MAFPEEIMINKRFVSPLVAVALVFALGVAAVADTIRLKDGSVLRGQIVSFRDQQFTVLIGSGARGRRSRITLYMEDVESIEFDGAGETASGTDAGIDDTIGTPAPARTSETTRPAPVVTRPSNDAGAARDNPTPRVESSRPASSNAAPFFNINVRVRADSTANGWTNTGLVVRRGQRLRINASGRVSLGGGNFSTPTGLPRVADTNKLLRNEPTGALIAVIGDDNDEFILVGSNREFTATRDGTLFLGINEGNLNDNTGTYDAIIEAEAFASSSSLR